MIKNLKLFHLIYCISFGVLTTLLYSTVYGMSTRSTSGYQFRRESVGRSSDRYALLLDGRPVPYSEFVNLVTDDEQTFRNTLIRVLQSVEFEGYLFECPPVSFKTLDSVPFEFVVTNAPGLVGVEPDLRSFKDHFDSCFDVVASFVNLGKDARLVVPCPATGISTESYTHLGAFVRGAPLAQVHTLWRTVGARLIERISTQKADVWLSTNGHGVSWLHIRLDSSPKYYAFTPYKTPSVARGVEIEEIEA